MVGGDQGGPRSRPRVPGDGDGDNDDDDYDNNDDDARCPPSCVSGAWTWSRTASWP